MVLDAGGWGVEMQRCIDAVIVGGGVWGGSEGHTVTSPLMGGHGRCSRGCYRDIRQCITSHEEIQQPALHLLISTDLICAHVRY